MAFGRLVNRAATLGGVVATLGGMVAIVSVLVLARIEFHQAGMPAAAASYRSEYQDEAEYNTWAGAEVDTEVYLPFVNSDPAWRWRTTAVVQNTGTGTATVALLYYDTGGTLANVLADTLPSMGSRAYPTTGVFSGSLVITATQPVAAIANQSPLDPDWTGDGLMSYRGVGGSGSADEIVLLPIYRAYQGWNSVLAVQNMANTSVAITLTFYNLTGTVVYVQGDNLPPRSAHWYDGAAMPDLGTDFYGRVHVRSTTHTPVVGAVQAVNSLTGKAVAHNNRPLKQVVGVWRLYLPRLGRNMLLMAHSPASYNSQVFTSGIVLHNPWGDVTNVVIEFYGQDGVLRWNYFTSLNPQAIVSLADQLWGVPSGFLGSGVVSSDRSIGVLANTAFTGYSGVVRSGTDTTAYVPFVRKSADGMVTQISVQNVATTTAKVFVTYYDEGGDLSGVEIATVPPYAARYFGQEWSSLPTPFRGSAVVTATQPIAVVGFIGHERPATPVLLSPPDNTLTRTAVITFAWSDVDAAGYNLKLDGSVFTSTDTYLATVLTDGTYTWTVRAFDAVGNCSLYATPWTLTVDTRFKVYLPIVIRGD